MLGLILFLPLLCNRGASINNSGTLSSSKEKVVIEFDRLFCDVMRSNPKEESEHQCQKSKKRRRVKDV